MFNSVTPWNVTLQAPLPSTISQSLFKFMSIESVTLSNHLILCHSLLFDLQSFPASGSFPVNQLFSSDGQSIGASASASVLPVNIQGWFPLGLTDLLSLLPKDSQQSSPAPQSETINSSVLSLGPALTGPYMTIGETIALTIWTFFGKVMSLLFNTLSRFDIAFLSRSKHLLISWLLSTSADTDVVSDFGAQENKVYHCFHFFPIYLPWSDGTGCHYFSFFNVEFCFVFKLVNLF